MTNKENYNKEVFDDFMSFYTCTPEDLERQLTDDQLKELCLRIKCSVRMSLWNPVEDIKHCLLRKGRLQTKTASQRIRFLEKCANHYRVAELYTDEEKKKFKEEEWRKRKKLNLLHVDLWEYERQSQEHQEPLSETQMSMRSTLSDCSIITVVHSMPNTCSDMFTKNSPSQPPTDVMTVVHNMPNKSLEDQMLDNDSPPAEVAELSNNTIENEFLEINTESMQVLSIDVDSQSQNPDYTPVINGTELPEHCVKSSQSDFECTQYEATQSQSQHIQFETESVPYTEYYEDKAQPPNVVIPIPAIPFSQETEYNQFHISVPCTSTQEVFVDVEN